MGFRLDPISVSKLKGVHPDLLKVINDCAENGVMPFHFGVSCGLRTLDQEKKYVAAGASQTLRSRHLDGHAVDLVVLLNDPPNEITWAWTCYVTLAEQMKEAAARVSVPIEWGGDWTTLKDGAHFQLPWASYPSQPGVHPPLS